MPASTCARTGRVGRPRCPSAGAPPSRLAGGRRLVEAHLIGFSGDLYGEEAEIRLLVRLRPQMTFASADDLAAQLQRDLAERPPQAS